MYGANEFLVNLIWTLIMDLTVHVKASGVSAAFALCLDVLPHQISAMAHITSILQMCLSYAESRPAQVEAHKQLKGHMDKVSFIQRKILHKKRNSVSQVRQGRPVRPLPAILGSEMDDSREEEPATSSPSSSRGHQPEPVRRMKVKAEAPEQSTPSTSERTPRMDASIGSLEPEPDSQEQLASLNSIDAHNLVSIPGEIRAPSEEAPALPKEERIQSPEKFLETPKASMVKCNSAPPQTDAEASVVQEKKAQKKKARTTFSWFQSLAPATLFRPGGKEPAAKSASEQWPADGVTPMPKSLT